MVRRFNIWLLIIIMTLLVAGIVISTWHSLTHPTSIDPDNVVLTMLGVCLPGEEAPTRVEPPQRRIPASEESVLACGQLSTTYPLHPIVYLFKDGWISPVDVSPPDEQTENGVLRTELRLPLEDRLGHYRIDIYLYRRKLGSAEFDVVR